MLIRAVAGPAFGRPELSARADFGLTLKEQTDA
jgi:hypothetical protein